MKLNRLKSNGKKTFWGSIVMFFLGSSCCWMSALALWLGGATIIGTTASYLEIAQPFLIGAGIVLGIITLFRFWKMKRSFWIKNK